jgi:hypothetical protein
VQLELPQINLLSKVDLIESYGELAFGLDFYTDVLDPSRLLPLLQVIAYDCGCCLRCRRLPMIAAAASAAGDCL